MDNAVLIIIVGILVLHFVFDNYLEYLNAKRWSPKLPDELAGIFDEEKYQKSQQYARDKRRLGFISGSFSFLLILAMLVTGGFGVLDQMIRQYTTHPVWLALLFFGIIGLVADLLSTPFDIYRTFVIEEKYNFNRSTRRTYVLDKLKGWMLSLVIGGGLLAVFVWFYQEAGKLFWVYAWVAFAAFSIFMAMFYNTLIVPLFNRQQPLEKGELRTAIETFARQQGFRLDNIFVIDGSRRSTKANAYFSGLGHRKRIVLFDTLIGEHTTDEVVAVLAHEIGHYKKRHTLKGMMSSLLGTGLMLYLLGLFVNRPELSYALGAGEPGFHLGLLAFGLLVAPLSLVLGILSNKMSRMYEYQADAWAAQKFRAKSLQHALKKLSVNHLSNLRPHPAYVTVHYSHPPLLKRLKHLEKYRKEDE